MLGHVCVLFLEFFFLNKNLFKTYLYDISIVKFKLLNCIKQFVLDLSFFVYHFENLVNEKTETEFLSCYLSLLLST